MYPLLFKFAAAAVTVVGATLIIWLANRNSHSDREREQTGNHRHQSNTKTRENQTDWTPPEDNPQDRCAVCLQELQGRPFRLPCSHQLHLDCAKALFEIYVKSSCPLCRGPVSREYLMQQGLSRNYE